MDYHIGQSHWVDLTKRDDVRVNTMLSKSHRRAAVSDFSISRMLIIMGVILKNRITIVLKKLAIIFFLVFKELYRVGCNWEFRNMHNFNGVPPGDQF